MKRLFSSLENKVCVGTITQCFCSAVMEGADGGAAEQKYDKYPELMQRNQAVMVVKLYQINNQNARICSAVVKGVDGYAAEQDNDKYTKNKMHESAVKLKYICTMVHKIGCKYTINNL